MPERDELFLRRKCLGHISDDEKTQIDIYCEGYKRFLIAPKRSARRS